MSETNAAGDEARTETDVPAIEKPRFPTLSGFQRDVLYVLRHDGPLHGLGIKEGLVKYYGENVNHGQLYPNLDDLVQVGLIEKGTRDQRTNEYELTDTGREALENREAWQQEKR